jgi:hypothetical protein
MFRKVLIFFLLKLVVRFGPSNKDLRLAKRSASTIYRRYGLRRRFGRLTERDYVRTIVLGPTGLWRRSGRRGAIRTVSQQVPSGTLLRDDCGGRWEPIVAGFRQERLFFELTRSTLGKP